MTAVLLLAAGACTEPDPEDTTSSWTWPTQSNPPVVDTIDTGGGTTVPTGTGLHGEVPETPYGVPTFTVTNRDGTPRTAADLMGHPTIMWFYPAAATGG